MTTDLAKIGNQLPADIREQLQKQAEQDVARLGQTGGKDVIRATQDKKFVFPDETECTEFECIIVDFVYRNEYYPGKYNPKQIVPPVCFAINPVSADLVPSANSPVRQAEVCASCQQNQWGSSNTGDGKACKNTVFLALMAPDSDEDSTLYVLKTSPTAIRPFNTFISKISRQTNLPAEAFKTRVYFDPAQSYGSVRFEVVGPNDIFAVTSMRREEARERLLVEPDVTSATEGK